MPIVAGIESRPERLFCANALTAILYARRVIAVLWLIPQGIRAIEKNVLVPVLGQTLRLGVGAAGGHPPPALAQSAGGMGLGDAKGFGILLIVSLAFFIIRGVRAVQIALLSEDRLDVPDNFTARRVFTQVSVIRKLVISIVLIVGTGAILMMFDSVRQLGTSILASAGIILGFAAQKTLGNLLAAADANRLAAIG